MANPTAQTERFPRIERVSRWVGAVIIGALVAGIVFLVIVETAQQHGYTDIRYNHSLGVLIGGEGTEARADEALGVSGDTAAPTGLLWNTYISLALMLVYGLTVPRWLRRPWYIQGLPLAVVVWLAAMFVYLPKISGLELEGVASVGPLGLDAGRGTPLVFALGAFGFGLIGARVFALVNSRVWWQKADVGVHSAFEKIEGMSHLHHGPGASPDRPVPDANPSAKS